MNRLREIRVTRRITQFQVRLITGISQTKISFIENGLVKPSPEEKEKLARFFGVRPDEIWGDEVEDGTVANR